MPEDIVDFSEAMTWICPECAADFASEKGKIPKCEKCNKWPVATSTLIVVTNLEEQLSN